MLFNRLSEGLSALQIPVSKKEIREEDSLIERTTTTINKRQWSAIQRSDLEKYLHELLVETIDITQKDNGE
jgi:hypothetical protein